MQKLKFTIYQFTSSIRSISYRKIAVAISDKKWWVIGTVCASGRYHLRSCFSQWVIVKYLFEKLNHKKWHKNCWIRKNINYFSIYKLHALKSKEFLVFYGFLHQDSTVGFPRMSNFVQVKWECETVGFIQKKNVHKLISLEIHRKSDNTSLILLIV